ncbi:efflux RND transporter permease subunit [Halosquirtibacter laminarini]|uniref:Efflux RND transporter permease subunit n=1 Tax=Halosquirtibacter laminarini TaxID=3374600 RepID=A0AC61NCV7_9BACT|nr:efflux RND transporter permease subunit [Prolixibacteraceae bacterium]
MRFSYGRDINYAFIDVNEKIDKIMQNMPKEFNRPAIMKASSTDLPVFYLDVSIKDKTKQKIELLELSDLVTNIIRKRIEQLEEVAMVDISGRVFSQISITPDLEKLSTLHISVDEIGRTINSHNRGFGSIKVKDGQYQYNIILSNGLNQVEDIKNIYFNIHDHLIQLKDIAKVEMCEKDKSGLFMTNGKDGISMAIVKQADARMEDMSEKIDEVLEYFSERYPFIEIQKVRDQTGILRYAMSNLFQSLWWGALLAFLVMFLFLRDRRSPWLIGVSVPISLVISLLLFYLLGISINIISLSGLILGVGMMIDNSIIVIDNISQRISMGESLMEGVSKGTHEVIRPLIASVLTTCAVFLPLVYLSGISGALFYDQAMAVTIGLSASLLVSITLIPTLYLLIWRKKAKKSKLKKRSHPKIFSTTDLYEQGWHWVFKHRSAMFVSFLLLIGVALLLTRVLPKERFPVLNENEVVVKVDWNNQINIEENRRRVQEFIHYIKSEVNHSDCYVGVQQFFHHNDLELSENECAIYLQLKEGRDKNSIEKKISEYFSKNNTNASFSVSIPPSGFTQMFEGQEAPFIVYLESNSNQIGTHVDSLNQFVGYLNQQYPFANISPFASEPYVEISLIPELLALYHIDEYQLQKRLKGSLKSNQVDLLKGASFIPIVVGENRRSMEQILKKVTIINKNQVEILVSTFLRIKHTKNFKTYYGSRDGLVFPIVFKSIGKNKIVPFSKEIEQKVHAKKQMNCTFGGSIIKAEGMIHELVVVLLIALSLLYFILAAQFESFTQPLIVLLEVPMDIAGALFLLWLGGDSINLMAMIGIVVMCGIIINDSILKIDTINQLRKQGKGVMEAIEVAGHRRLKPILMTSITTILALIPFLVGNDMGSILQRPLALVIIGGMTLGTFVSLYFVPLCYYFLYRNSKPTII